MEIQPATNDLVTLDNVLLLADRDPGDIAYAHTYKYAKALLKQALDIADARNSAERGGQSIWERLIIEAGERSLIAPDRCPGQFVL
jgi:hypothetical protein